MKDDPIYPYYLCYLNARLENGNLSDGSFALMKISESAFGNFKFEYENNPRIRDQIDKLCISENRNKKIDDIFDD